MSPIWRTVFALQFPSRNKHFCTLPRSKITIVTSVEQNQQNPVSDIRAKKKLQQKYFYCILCFALTVACMPQRFSLGDMHALKLICKQLTDSLN
jgi:hypothetical protein